MAACSDPTSEESKTKSAASASAKSGAPGELPVLASSASLAESPTSRRMSVAPGSAPPAHRMKPLQSPWPHCGSRFAKQAG